MKYVNLTYEDKEFLKVKKMKGDLTWREFINNAVPLMKVKKILNEEGVMTPEVARRLEAGK